MSTKVAKKLALLKTYAKEMKCVTGLMSSIFKKIYTSAYKQEGMVQYSFHLATASPVSQGTL